MLGLKLFVVVCLLPLISARPQASESLESCAGAPYYASEYTCYESNFLCPILDGVPTQKCADDCYLPAKYTCYDTNFLCPVVDGVPTLKCGSDCYLPAVYSCSNNALVYPPSASSGSSYSASAASSASIGSSSSYGASSATSSASASATSSSGAPACSTSATTFELDSPPYYNYFYSDCNVHAQVVVESPLPDSNLSLIGPRFLVAWPRGDSGLLAYFAPQNGINGSLGIQLSNSSGSYLTSYYATSYNSSNQTNPLTGISAQLTFNSSAVLTVPILGSIRTMRDFTEGPSILIPLIQDAIVFSQTSNQGAMLSRIWLDNVTYTELSFVPYSSGASATVNNRTVNFEPGTYTVTAALSYPALTQLSEQQVLNSASQGLIQTQALQVESLSFLSYTTKLLAGGWRFLTYFGRDTNIAELLLQPVLSEGPGSAVEAVIGATLERMNRTNGYICHEETIGDYATYQHLLNNVSSTAPIYSYIMVDSHFYLQTTMQNYFVKSTTGQQRASAFFSTPVTVNPANFGLNYGQLALVNAEYVMNTTAAFASSRAQSDLVHLEPDQIVGEWRDSTYGIGGARIPFDLNSALVPAALRAIAALSRAGIYPEHPDWSTTADQYAQVWEDNTLQFFEETLSASDARNLVTTYVQESGFAGPSNVDQITSNVSFYGLGLNGNNNQSLVAVQNSDTCFRLFLLNTTNQAQLTSFLNNTANSVIQPFPLGLSTSIGMLIANPAYGSSPVYAANWTTALYHGTVVWSWPIAMMAAGLGRQLGRCEAGGDKPDYCSDTSVYGNVKNAYNHLWDNIEANNAHLTEEVWSWRYNNGFVYTPLGDLSPTESDIVQLWSLTFLAVTRDPAFA